MGKVDAAAKECFSSNVRFADLCNAVLFDGEQIVKPERLTEKDSTEVLSIFGADSKQMHVQKWRDLLKNAVVKTDDNVCFVLIGVEAQAKVHYAMPVYLGSQNWDAPRCLMDMYKPVDERLRPYLQDFSANVFVPGEVEDFGKFKTDLKQIFEVLSASGDKNKMKQILTEDKQFQEMDNETVRTINDLAGTKFPLAEKGKVNNMVCKAWEEQYEDGRAEGLSQGISQGISQGVQKGKL